MRKSLACAVAAALCVASVSHADDGAERQNGSRTFEVSITNITPGISFTPVLVATHSPRVSFFRLGQPASDGLAILAEGGDTAPLGAALASTGEVLDTATSSGLLNPGQTVKLRIRAGGRHDRLSLAAMLLPTNDSFVAVNSFDLPWDRRAVTLTAIGYDAGSEPNDEKCRNIPGPVCGGEGASPGAGGEGFVHVSNGIQGIAELPAANYDWRNPVASVTIRRVD